MQPALQPHPAEPTGTKGHEAFRPVATQKGLDCRSRVRLCFRDETLAPAERRHIEDNLSFLDSLALAIHTLVLVGSRALGVHRKESDIDIVIITTEKGHDQVCETVFAREIEESLADGGKPPFEFTVLAAPDVEELFRQSSPFAYSIRHGTVIRDDGFLLRLRQRRFPPLPDRKYVVTCLEESIAPHYYGLLKKFRKEARAKKCSPGCARKAGGCSGLRPAHRFAKLILRMFYVTLPARGMIPLTKDDVAVFAELAYGRQGKQAAEQVIALMREKRFSFCFNEFRELKDFAVRLFREVLQISGIDETVRAILSDSSRLARQDFQAISNPAIRNCVL
ncbi:MAG: hypothetical protein Kow0089_02430 [Desulfobulbaceae bacterium]